MVYKIKYWREQQLTVNTETFDSSVAECEPSKHKGFHPSSARP